MIKEYKKILIMSVVLLILVICIVVVFTTDVSMAGIKSGCTAGIVILTVHLEDIISAIAIGCYFLVCLCHQCLEL